MEVIRIGDLASIEAKLTTNPELIRDVGPFGSVLPSFIVYHSGDTTKTETFRYLLDFTIQIAPEMLVWFDQDSGTPLHAAASSGRVDLAEMIFDTRRMDVDILNSDGSTPLLDAVDAIYDHLPMAKFLVARGANVNTANVYGNTALHSIGESANLQMARFLVSNGAQIDVSNHNGETPLHWLTHKYSRAYPTIDCLKYLLQLGGPMIDRKDNRGRSVFDLLKWNPNRRVEAEMIAACSSEIQYREYFGMTEEDIMKYRFEIYFERSLLDRLLELPLTDERD